MNDLPFEWIPGEVVEQAYVEIDGVKHYVTPTRYADGTSLSAYHLNRSEYETIKRVNGTILWENPNPTADFTAQTITLSSSDYDMLEILYRSNAVGGIYFGGNRKILKGYGTQLDWNSISSTNRWSRRMTPVSDTAFSVGDSTLVNTGALTNDQCVPLYIIGYKTGLFGGQS